MRVRILEDRAQDYWLMGCWTRMLDEDADKAFDEDTGWGPSIETLDMGKDIEHQTRTLDLETRILEARSSIINYGSLRHWNKMLD